RTATICFAVPGLQRLPSGFVRRLSGETVLEGRVLDVCYDGQGRHATPSFSTSVDDENRNHTSRDWPAARTRVDGEPVRSSVRPRGSPWPQSQVHTPVYPPHPLDPPHESFPSVVEASHAYPSLRSPLVAALLSPGNVRIA